MLIHWHNITVTQKFHIFHIFYCWIIKSHSSYELQCSTSHFHDVPSKSQSVNFLRFLPTNFLIVVSSGIGHGSKPREAASNLQLSKELQIKNKEKWITFCTVRIFFCAFLNSPQDAFQHQIAEKKSLHN